MRVLLAAALLSPITWWSAPVTAQPSDQQTAGAESDYPPVYRIEVIVFGNTGGGSDRRAAPAPADFTDRLDPLLVTAAVQAARRQLAGLARFLPVAEMRDAPGENTPYLKTSEETLRPIPPLYAALGELSSPVQRALDRLSADPAYEPIVARAWMQLAPPQRHTAAVRLHDAGVVETLEPASAAGAVPVARVLPFGPLIDPPPPAAAIYRLDGTVRLRRRRFLHLDLDLVWQTPTNAASDTPADADAQVAATTDATATSGAASRPDRRDAMQWELHRLRQSRVVRPGRLEYFDSSLFGVLVRIERFEQVVPQTVDQAPETDPESDPESAAPAPDAR